MSDADFTEPTLAYWQELHDDVPPRFSAEPPYRFGYPARLPDGRVLVLPLRAIPPGERAVASLIANQASHTVVDALAEHMAILARELGAERIVGLPTLGLAFAATVARRLGQPRMVPLGYSDKFWYRDDLSEPVASITSPRSGKRLRVDPNLLPLLHRSRVVIVDDAISSGSTIAAALRLLGRIGVAPAGIVVAMKQGVRWEETLASIGTGTPAVRTVYGCPIFVRHDEGWWPAEGTMPVVP